MAARYYAYNEDAFRPSQYSNNTRVKNPKDQAVVSKFGAAPEGYYQAGTQTVSNKAGDQTYNIFRPLQTIAPPTEAEEVTEDPLDEDLVTQLPIDATPETPYSEEIDETLEEIEEGDTGLDVDALLSGITSGFGDTIGKLTEGIDDLGTRLAGIMESNTKDLADMQTKYQMELRKMQEAQVRAQQEREFAAQIAAANRARSAQGPSFQLGSGGMIRGMLGGIAGFKRRGPIKASTSNALAISANNQKSANKMLNV